MKIHHFKSTSSYIGRFIGYTLTFLLFMNNDSLLGLFGLFLVFSLKYMPKLYPNIFNTINPFFVVCNFSYFIQISSEQNLKIIETLRQQRAIFKFRSTFCGGWNFTLMAVALITLEHFWRTLNNPAQWLNNSRALLKHPAQPCSVSK